MSDHPAEPAPQSLYTAEMQAELARMGGLLTEAVDFSRPPDAAARDLDVRNNAIWNVDLPELETVRRLELPPHPSLPAAAACKAVVFEPRDPKEGCIFYVHGGGWAFMNLETHERFMRVLCAESGRAVVGVHYRLAPDHQYPAGLTDVVSAYRWLRSEPSRFALPAGPVVVAGDSAGGNLSLALLLHECDAGRPSAAGALLFYGVFGADFDTFSYREYADGHLLTTPIMRQLWDWYVPDAANRADPYAAPLAASDAQLGRLPPLFLAVAEIDPLASDSYELKRRLDGLGRHDEMVVEPGVVHGFMQMTAVLVAARRVTQQAAAAASRFIDQASAEPAPAATRSTDKMLAERRGEADPS